MPPEIAKVGPKDTANAGYVKPPPVPTGPGPGCVNGVAFPCHGAQNPYKPRIRGSRPGAERTVSAISPILAMLMWQGQSVRRPVLPPSELIVESFPKVSKGLPPGTAPTLGKDTHASL
jgi:hypothetical protein